jgi:hypothetical protein
VIFLLEGFKKRKNNDESILILVIYWKETGLLRTKIANIIQFIHHRNTENRH